MLTVETYLDQPADAEDLATAAAYVVAGQRLAATPAAVVAAWPRRRSRTGRGPLTRVPAIVDRVLPLLDRHDDPLVTTIAGGMRLSVYLATRTFELVVHGVDIADALGVAPPALRRRGVAAALELTARSSALREQAPAVSAR